MNGISSFFIALFTVALATPQAPLSVAEAVRIARQNNPEIRAARMETKAAQIQTGREKPIALPTLTAQVEGTLQGPRVTFSRAGHLDAIVLPEQYGKIALTLEQPLYRPGLGAAKERYHAQTQANAWEEQRVENDVILQVKRAYFQLLTAQAMAEVAHNGLELAQKHLKLMRDMQEAGMASMRDVKAAEADLAQAEQGLLKAETGVSLARGNLNRLLGRDPSTPIETAPSPPLPTVPESTAAGIALALTRRPEIRRLEESIRAARAGVSLARTQSGPALSARAVAARQTPSAFVNQNYLAASLVLTWSPFDAGKTRADVGEAQARVGQLEALLEEAKLGIRLEVEKAWRSMQEAQARLQAARRQVAAAEAALEVSELRYQARVATQLEVASARLEVARARGNVAEAIGDLHIAAAEYAHATGVDIAPEMEVSPF
jgi:outer membrane protein TolC